MGRRRAALTLLGVLVLPVLVACSGAPTPICRQAAALADGHHLTAALSRYLDAQRASEGDCATDGQRDVQNAQAKVGLVLARAASAERRGSLAEAEDLYVQALTQDVDNEQARTAIGRVQAAARHSLARRAPGGPGGGGQRPGSGVRSPRHGGPARGARHRRDRRTRLATRPAPGLPAGRPAVARTGGRRPGPARAPGVPGRLPDGGAGAAGSRGPGARGAGRVRASGARPGRRGQDDDRQHA